MDFKLLVFFVCISLGFHTRLCVADLWCDFGAPGIFVEGSPWSWIDPGVFALLGAGAFMAGVCRLTLSLAVILMEMSNEVA